MSQSLRSLKSLCGLQKLRTTFNQATAVTAAEAQAAANKAASPSQSPSLTPPTSAQTPKPAVPTHTVSSQQPQTQPSQLPSQPPSQPSQLQSQLQTQPHSQSPIVPVQNGNVLPTALSGTAPVTSAVLAATGATPVTKAFTAGPVQHPLKPGMFPTPLASSGKDLPDGILRYFACLFHAFALALDAHLVHNLFLGH